MPTASGPVLAAWELGTPDGPPIVLLHGLTMTADQAFGGAPALARRGFRVIAFDARGHGRSTAAAGPGAYGYDLLSADLLAVMDAFEVERAALAGISMGAHTALRLALAEPRRAAGLAVISPAFDPDDHPKAEHVSEARSLSAGVREDGIGGFVAALQVPNGLAGKRAAISAAQALTRRRLAAHEDLVAIADAIESNLLSRPFERLAQLASIEVPALVVGSHDELDPRHPLALARAYAGALPDCRFECEEPGEMPLGWGGRRLTRLIGELAERAWGAPN